MIVIVGICRADVHDCEVTVDLEHDTVALLTRVEPELDDLVESARKGNSSITHFDLSCFDGQYVTGDVSEGYLNEVEAQRSDEAKQRRAAASNSLQDMHSTAQLADAAS